MAFELHRHGFQQPIKAPSLINPKRPVRLAGTNALMAFAVGSNADRPFGFTGLATGGPAASGVTYTGAPAITVYEEGNVVKAVAAASLGVGVEVGVASDNGSLSVAAAASGRWAVGISETPAAAGETFSLYVKIRQVY